MSCGLPASSRTTSWQVRSPWRATLKVAQGSEVVGILLILLLVTGLTSGQYSSHCHFNQLCSCRVVPVKKPAYSTSGASSGYKAYKPYEPSTSTTTPGVVTSTRDRGGSQSYTGQFGILIPEYVSLI